MFLVGEQVLLRVYLQSADRAPHMPTYERLLKAARAEGLAGATVLQGILGAGYHGIHRTSAWSIVQHLPVILEIVDRGDRISQFVAQTLEPTLSRGMFTLERAVVGLYRGLADKEPGARIHLPGAIPPLSTLPTLQPGTHMEINENGVLLRIFIGEADRWEGRPLFEAIVQKARENGLAGATVLRGTEGFGANSVVHRAGLMEMSPDLPIVIEIVDVGEKIQAMLPLLEAMVSEGLITMERVMIYTKR